MAETWTEIGAAGKRLDYILYDQKKAKKRHCWFIIEAKLRSQNLVKNTKSQTKRFKLSGPILKKNVWPIIENQMSHYIGRYNPSFGIVTNGEQWIGFLAGELLSDIDRRNSHALVFRSLEHIEQDFETFYDAFSRTNIYTRFLLQELEPERNEYGLPLFSLKRIVEKSDITFLDYQNRQKEFYKLLRIATETAFHPITNDPFMLEKCFVDSRQSQNADEKLARMADELGFVLQSAMNDYPVAIEDKITSHNDWNIVPEEEDLKGEGYLARIIGEPSAGKSTFLRRLHRLKLSDESKTILIWIDCANNPNITPEILGKIALKEVKTGLFGGPDMKDVLEIYKSEWKKYQRFLGINEKTSEEIFFQVRQQFLLNKNKDEKSSPGNAFIKYLAFAVKNRRKLPLIVVDNVDNVEVAAIASRWIRAIYANSYALTTIAFDDTTLLRLRAKQQQDQLTRYGIEDFWLPRPKVREVLENRLEYLRFSLESLKEDSQSYRNNRIRTRLKYFKWNVKPKDVVQAVHSVLLLDPKVSTWIGQICNYNMTDIFEVCKEVLLSPHVRVEDLFNAQTIDKPISKYRILKALITTKTHQFEQKKQKRVLNIFEFHTKKKWYSLLPARVLIWLHFQENSDPNTRNKISGYVFLSQIFSVFDELAVPLPVIRELIELLFYYQLIESFDPNVELLDENNRVKITPRGKLHLDWATQEITYVKLMAEVTFIGDEEQYSVLKTHHCAMLTAFSKHDRKKSDRKKSDRKKSEREERLFVTNYVKYLLQHATLRSSLNFDFRQQWIRFEQQLASVGKN